MTRAIKTTAVVGAGGRVEITAPELQQGDSVEIIILESGEQQRRSLDEILEGYPGGRLFKTAEEVDSYLRAERESWEH